jgi:protein-tyrosine-phosphatase
MVEFRQDPESGRLALMEVNGRYWGSLPLSYLAGLEFPWYEWQMSHGVNPTPPKNYHRVTMRWTAGEIDRTIQVFGEVLRGRIPFSAGLREAFSFTMGFFFSVKDAVWRWDDAQPAWIELRKVWRKAFRPQLRKALDKLFPVFWQRKADHKEFGGARAGKLYRQLARGELLINDGRPTVSGKSILVLCHGNIIRSPFVAQRLRTALPAAKIVSAGLACIPGRPADARAITMARKYNVNLEEHRAQPISKTLVNEADVILVMDRRNLAMLLATWPHAASKVYCITNWSEGMTEISDPYNGNMESVGRCYELLNGVCENIAIEE